MTDQLLQAAEEVARVAGDIALGHFKRGIAVETKKDGSPVTIADRAAETAVRDWLARRFPDDGILGEEFGEVRPAARRRWIIDPIDGTRSFVHGVPLWGTLIAVCEGDYVLAGAAYCPAVNELVVAAPGLGCWWNGARCAVSQTHVLADATVLSSDVQFHGHEARGVAWRVLADRAGIARTWGDAFGYVLVATGRAEVIVDPVMNVWDAAPFLPIIEEAGGVFTDWSGARTVSGGSAIATNRALARDVRALLAERVPT